MWIVLLTLLVPFVGITLLVTDASRQTALPFQSRRLWFYAVRGLSVFCLVLAAGLVVTTLVVATDESQPWLLLMPLLGGLGWIVGATGYLGLRVPRSWPDENEDWDDPAVIERCTPHSLLDHPPTARLRSGAWVMVLYPLLFLIPILGFFGIALFFIGTVTLTTIVHVQRGFQSQLLWLLAIALRHRLPLSPELRQLGIRRGVSLRKRLNEAADNLRGGDPLWLVLERARLLPAAAVSAIRVAEGGGRLEETVRRLAVNSTDRLKVFNLSGLSDVLTQFIVTLTAMATITGGMMYFIIPKLKEIFEGFDVELPGPTQALTSSSDYVINRGFTPIIFWIGLVIAGLVWMLLRHIVGWSSLSVPLLMHFYPRRDAPEILRVLAGLIRDQAALPEKLRELSHRRGRPDLGARYHRMGDRLMAGESLSVALSNEGVLNPSQTEAVAAAERGGHLEFVLFAMADALEQREFRQSSTWAELVKPVSTLVCAALVAFFVIAFFLPLVKLIKELS